MIHTQGHYSRHIYDNVNGRHLVQSSIIFKTKSYKKIEVTLVQILFPQQKNSRQKQNKKREKSPFKARLTKKNLHFITAHLFDQWPSSLSPCVISLN